MTTKSLSFVTAVLVAVLLGVTVVEARVADCALVSGISVAHLKVITPEGSLIDKTEMQASQWIPIPSWLAGIWQMSSETALEQYDFTHRRYVNTRPVTIPVKRQSILGNYRDAQGQIWHFAKVPFERTIQTKSFVEHQNVQRLSLVYSGPLKVMVDSMAAVTRLDRQGRILDAYYEQTQTSYSPVKPGVIQITYRINDFDLQGNLVRYSYVVSIATRSKILSPPNRNETKKRKRSTKRTTLKI